MMMGLFCMRPSSLSAMVRQAIALARGGVAWDHGACCPVCGRRMKTASSGHKGDSPRVRWHRCGNASCLLASMALLVKSVEG